ncbi:MBL fold metallo-hydrolase [Caproicibacterium sp. BJN0003]|uniref:MBL fold metallo-hydrolase n=1 Tax=Caproicibacterium sp. BJN0003 TaxID=2994078 RepID=UPI002257A818|nr:MBL fold metallo-hydrolase [Caproicibacterium sp. BJN0003]UZT81120.1 MBL fold metallo-hydrolase [Caproicibacterium sp. BJN0003]
MNTKIWYLYNSGFVVETEDHLLIFDDCTHPTAGGTFDQGFVDESVLPKKDTIVFVSHSHLDHFDPHIFKWREFCPRIRYILSNDLPKLQKALYVAPDTDYDMGDIKIHTLTSTDLGVAFLIWIDNLCIYHAGDLNWWHWEGDTQENNAHMKAAYQKEIDSIKGKKIDIAFVPMDPRLENQYLWGLDYFMRTVGADVCIPMHFGDNYSCFEKVKEDPMADPYRSHLVNLTHCGQEIDYISPESPANIHPDH